MRYPRVSAPLLFLVCLFAALAPAHAQDTCYSSTVPTGVDYQVPAGQVCGSGYFYDVNLVANDYAILYFDAKKPGCAAAARDRFEAKLRANLNYANAGGKICDPRRDTAGALPATDPFQPALGGAIMIGVYSTAVALLDRGYAVDDILLQGVRDHHSSIPSPQDPRCGVTSLPNVNSCMDDYTVTAAGFGWIAAYEARRGRTANAGTWAGRADGEIDKSLTPWNQYGSVCYYRKGSNPVRCDATRTDVEQNLANVIGADHNQENPGYGFGLMTSVATACEGMRRAGYPCTFNSDQVWIARQLLLSAQQRAYYDTVERAYKFNNYCLHFPTRTNIGCWDPLFGGGGYLPTLFPLKRFYDSMWLTPSPISAVIHNGWGPHPAFQFHEYREPRFTWDRTNFYGPLRKLVYEELAYLVWPAHSPQAFLYWIQPAELAGFGAPGSLTVAGGSTQSGPSYPVTMYWRNISTGSGWSFVPYQATPDPNGNPKDVWYNSVPAPTNPWDWYEVAVQHSGGPWFYCTYKGGNTIWWCMSGNSTPAWP